MKKVLYIFGELNDSDVDWMIQTGGRRTISTGDTLIRVGEQVDGLYILLEGVLSVRIGPATGREIAKLGAGEIVGEMSFVDSRPASASVLAVESSSVFAIDRARLLDKIEHDEGFAARFYRSLAVFLSNRLRRTVSLLGFGFEAAMEQEDESDQLDPALLDNVYLAGARFDRMVKRLADCS